MQGEYIHGLYNQYTENIHESTDLKLFEAPDQLVYRNSSVVCLNLYNLS